MEIKIEGGKIHIVAPIDDPLSPSGSGKSLNLFTSGGVVRTTAQYQGNAVKIGLNVFIKNADYVDPKAKK
ncbi:MAG: hypothetical protein ACLQVL_36770 [Terriglobia bacterium]